MAKYDIAYSCGHSGTVELFGPDKSRKYRLERLAEEICPDCARAKKAAARRDAGLGELIGSEKQIAWACDIQIKKLRALDELEAELRAAPGSDGPGADIVFAAVAHVRASLKAETMAAEIIDRRDFPVRIMVRDECRNIRSSDVTMK